MSDIRSGVLAAWARAWLRGEVSLDQVVDAVTGDDDQHLVAGLVEFEHVPLRDLLVSWRRAGAPIQAVLPAAGDPRGLPGPAEVRAAALEAGEAVVVGDVGQPGTAAVPEVVDYHPSSRPSSVLWTVYATDPLPVDHQSLGDIQYELTTAIRDCASALAAIDVARLRDDMAGALQAARRVGEDVNLPPGFPGRAVAMLAQSERLQAVLDLAWSDADAGAVDVHESARRADALRPLATAVRRARVAAYNATAFG